MTTHLSPTVRILPATLVAILLVGVSISLPAAAPQAASGLGASVTFAPMKENASVFMCSVEVKDLGSGAVISAPQLQVKRGSTAKARSGEQASGTNPGWQLDLAVSIDAAGTKAGYTVTYSKAGHLVATQSSSLALQ